MTTFYKEIDTDKVWVLDKGLYYGFSYSFHQWTKDYWEDELKNGFALYQPDEPSGELVKFKLE